MAQANSYPTVSDGIAAIIAAFEPTRKTGMVMTRKNVEIFLEGLQALHDQARHVETIADRAQWNKAARREALEAGIADGSVSVFPVVARPIPARPAPKGGAA